MALEKTIFSSKFVACLQAYLARTIAGIDQVAAERFRLKILVVAKTQIMSEIWKTLGNEEREAYRSRARDEQKRYKAEQADKVSFWWFCPPFLLWTKKGRKTCIVSIRVAGALTGGACTFSRLLFEFEGNLKGCRRSCFGFVLVRTGSKFSSNVPHLGSVGGPCFEGHRGICFRCARSGC